MGPLRRIAAILWKELRQLRRDRLTFAMIIGIPTIQVLLFGYAIRQDVRHLPAAIADLAHTQSSRQLRLDAGGVAGGRHRGRGGGAGELEAMLEHGEIAVGIYVPPDFERRLIDGRPAAQLLIDGSDPAYGLTARALARSAGRAAARAPRARRDAPTFELRTYYNPEARSEVNIVPALIGVILTLTMVLFTAVAIVRERERGNLELLITTPVRSIELMAGKIVPYVLIGLVQVTLILIVGATVFQVPVRGRVVDLYLGGAGLHRRQPLARPPDLDRRQDPVPVGADDGLLLPAVAPAVGLHVPVRQHAGAAPASWASCCRSPTSCASCAGSCCAGRRSTSCAARSGRCSPSSP